MFCKYCKNSTDSHPLIFSSCQRCITCCRLICCVEEVFATFFLFFFLLFTCSGFAGQSQRMEKESRRFNKAFFLRSPGGCFPPWEWRSRAWTPTSSITSPWTSSPWTTRDTGSGRSSDFSSVSELPKCSIRLVLDFIAFSGLEWKRNEEKNSFNW